MFYGGEQTDEEIEDRMEALSDGDAEALSWIKANDALLYARWAANMKAAQQRREAARREAAQLEAEDRLAIKVGERGHVPFDSEERKALIAIWRPQGLEQKLQSYALRDDRSVIREDNHGDFEMMDLRDIRGEGKRKSRRVKKRKSRRVKKRKSRRNKKGKSRRVKKRKSRRNKRGRK